MGKFKFKLGEINVGDTSQQNTIKSTVTDVDPETGSITWDIEYKKDIKNIISNFQMLRKNFKNLFQTPQYKKDQTLINLYKDTNLIFNKFRTHIRNNYAEEYSNIKEISSTGNGASFSGGDGEQYMSKKISNPQKYTYKLGYKLVPKKIKGSGLEVKQLWEEDTDKAQIFQKKRIEAFDEIQNKIKEINGLLDITKSDTIKYYKIHPESYSVVYSTDLILDYINDIETLLNKI
jgi:hypothetical protein